MIFLLASSSKIRFPMRRVFIRSELLAEAEADRLLDLFARVSSFWYVELSARSERVSTKVSKIVWRVANPSIFFSDQSWQGQTSGRLERPSLVRSLSRSPPQPHDSFPFWPLVLLKLVAQWATVSMKAASFTSRRKEGTPGSASQYKSRGLAIVEHIPWITNIRGIRHGSLFKNWK